MPNKVADCLGFIAWDEDGVSENRGVKISMLEKLPSNRAQEISAAIRELHFVSSGEDLYYCYNANMQELIASVFEFAKSYLELGHMEDDILSAASFNFSRLTLNLLGMFKSFLDHGHAALVRRFGEQSEEVTSWKAAQSEQYDQSMAYRFFYNLRNYAQHVGMPPLHFSLNHDAEKEGVEVVLEFHRSELLASYNRWSKDAKADLIGGEEHIHMLPLLDDWSHCFHRLVTHIQSVRRGACLASANMIVALRSEFKIPGEGTIVLMPEPVLNDGGQLNFGYRKIPEKKAIEIVDDTFLKGLEA
ncbi:hypothetical protein D3C77_331560 [compost metagenome]